MPHCNGPYSSQIEATVNIFVACQNNLITHLYSYVMIHGQVVSLLYRVYSTVPLQLQLLATPLVKSFRDYLPLQAVTRC